MLAASFHMHDMDGGWWMLMMLGWAVIWGFLIWTVVSLLRERSSEKPSAPQASAQQILDRRLAAGELDVEEYERLRDHIRASAATS